MDSQKKEKIFENDKFETYDNSEEFICIFVKKLNELFGFINPNYNKSDVFNLILDKNQLYLKVLETKYLYEELINI